MSKFFESFEVFPIYVIDFNEVIFRLRQSYSLFLLVLWKYRQIFFVWNIYFCLTIILLPFSMEYFYHSYSDFTDVDIIIGHFS